MKGKESESKDVAMQKNDVKNIRKTEIIGKSQMNVFYSDIREIIETSRGNAARSIDFCRVQMYWNMGKRIFEEEQQGKERADYGTYLIRNLANVLEPVYGSGFSVRQLEQSRQFYRTYPIANTVRSQLNWSQYLGIIQSIVAMPHCH